MGHVLCNRYLVEELCDQTETSAVFRAYHLAFDRQVLVEVLPRRVLGDPRVLAPAREEALRLSTPSARCLELACLRGRWPVFVYPYRPGATLATHLRTSGNFSLQRLVPLAQQMAGAVAAAHEVGLTHGALDLDRLWLHLGGRRRESLSVLGFGAQRLPGARVARPPSGVFLRGVSPGEGRVEGDSETSSAETEVREDLKRVGHCLLELAGSERTTHGAIERGFDRILQRCLEPTADSRYGSARELCFDLYRLECTARGQGLRTQGQLAPIAAIQTVVHAPARRRPMRSTPEPKVIVQRAVGA